MWCCTGFRNKRYIVLTGTIIDYFVGLSTALVEKEDFGSGTSSRSTKLIHGGVRYLEKAILGLDYEQYKLVKEALHERANLLEIAPHLSHPLPIMLPVYRYILPAYIVLDNPFTVGGNFLSFGAV